MFAVMSDKRKKQLPLPIICSRCGFPEITFKEANNTKTVCAQGPLTLEEALVKGWGESELGMICPFCVGEANQENLMGDCEFVPVPNKN